MNTDKVYVCVVVDDLGARSDPERSDRIAGYMATEEEIKHLLELIRKLSGRRSWKDSPPWKKE